jgi:diguanylate cyclase
MKETEKQHGAITAKVKEKIQSIKIVFPALYGKLYTDEARLLNVDLNPDEMLDSAMLNEKVVYHVIKLSSCAEQAIAAIESEDKLKLHAVLEETKTLRDEIHALQKIVYEDALTKSYNRKWFEDHFLSSDKQTMSLDGVIAMIDLNKFKHINDTYGHVVGDKILVHIAHKLKEIGGHVVRFGGDEFLVVFGNGESVAKIEKKIDSMLLHCAKTSFKFATETFKVSFAYGVTAFEKGAELSSVIDFADKAMYLHKKSVQ